MSAYVWGVDLNGFSAFNVGIGGAAEDEEVLSEGPTATLRAGGGGEDDEPGEQKRLKTEDALAYLDQVRSAFPHQPHVYNDFLSP